MIVQFSQRMVVAIVKLIIKHKQIGPDISNMGARIQPSFGRLIQQFAKYNLS
jgi:hypothetical protein